MRIALPKGHLQKGVLDFLAQAGFVFKSSGDRDYRMTTDNASISGKLFKVKSIPQLVALGNFEVGFCGYDLVQEAGYDNVVSLLDLGLNRVELVVAVPAKHKDILADPPKRPLLIATEYEKIADRWALNHNLAHITIQTYGSTEAFAPEDADIVFDCCETGKTIEANGLIIIDHIFESTTHMIANRFAVEDRAKQPAIIDFQRAISKTIQKRV